MARAAETRYAVISAGTNSCRFLLATRVDGGGFREDYHETRGTRLGEGVHERRTLSGEAVERTLAAVRDYATLAKSVNRVFGIGTSALRDAVDADAFASRFEEAAGVPLTILTGDEEASSSFEGAVLGLQAAGREVGSVLTVVDVGGGSTEFAQRTAGSSEPRVASLQIGAVRLTEQCLRGDPPLGEEIDRCRQAVRAELAALPSDARPSGTIVAVGGTANTAARMLQLTDATDRRVADISAADLTALVKATLALPVSERKRMRGLPAQRADIIGAGLIVLDEIVRAAGALSLMVCESDLLLGYISRHG